ncbi:MAG TPA: hypothetical protein DGR79_08295 [Clostridiales bacterium]|nr:hypothetical protein [Clostridiales bacterium]
MYVVRSRLSHLSFLRFGRDMHLIVISVILANIGTRVEERFFPLYVRDLGGSPADIGLLASIMGLAMVLLAPLGGWLTDRYRRVTLYALAPLIGAAGAMLMRLAPSWEWLIPGSVLGMMPGLLVGPALFGLISDLGPEESRGARFAYEMAAFGVCGAVGPLVGGLIYEHLGYRTFLLIQACMLCLAAAVRSFIRDPRDAARRASGYRHPAFLPGLKAALGFMFASRQFRLVIIMACLVGFGMAATMNFFSVFMSEVVGVDEADMGLVYSLAGVAGIAASLAGGVAADRFGRKPVLVWSLVGMAAVLFWFTGARSLASLSVVWLLSGLADNLGGPAMDAFLADLTDTDSRGTVMSVFNSLQSVVLLPGPLVGGFLWEAVAPAAPFWFGGAVILVGAVILALWVRETREAPVPGDGPHCPPVSSPSSRP